MTEGNTCYRGGKPDVSDAFAAALWSADYSLLLASNNYSASICTQVRANLCADPVGGSLLWVTQFCKQMAKLPNRLPGIRIRSIHQSRRLGRIIQLRSRSRTGPSLQVQFSGGVPGEEPSSRHSCRLQE